MNDYCRYEQDVMRAARENRWTESLERHVASCADCAAAASVSGWMDRFAATAARDVALPSASAVWLKAQLLGNNARAARIALPLNVFQRVAYFVVAAGWAALITWKWSALHAWLLSFTPQQAIVAGTAAAPVPITFFAGIVVLLSLTMGLALHTILAEE